MKISIWIKKDEVLTGNITEYHTHDQQGEYINVLVTVDEFAKLEDETHERWLVSQFNRNRDHDEQIRDVNQIQGRSHSNYIYERNPDTDETTRRVSGDYNNKQKIK